MSNGRLINTESGYGWAENLVRLNQKEYGNVRDLTNGPYEAVVYGIEDTPSHRHTVDDEGMKARTHEGLKSDRYKFYAYIVDQENKIPMPGPEPVDWVVIYSSGQPGGVQQDQALVAQIKGLPCFYVDEDATPPAGGERVYVDWRIKPSNKVDEWREPFYVRPLSTKRPLYAKLKDVTTGAAKAFSQAASGQVHTGSPLLDINVYNNPTSWYPNIPLKGFLEASGLVHVLKEIYVDKELDYSKVKNYNIIPGSKRIEDSGTNMWSMSKYVQHRKQNKVFLLPEDLTIKQRKKTKLFIIRETGKNYIETYNNIYSNPTMHYNIAMNSVLDGSSKGLKNKSTVNRDRICTIRVNIPYGLVINEDDDFSSTSVGCMISSPYDGRQFFGPSALWDRSKTVKQINESKEFKNFKSKLNNWLTTKKLPDGSSPFILGPYGTCGLRTGKMADQNADILDLSDNHFWTGRLAWTSTGHYFLPALEQADALYELLTSLMESPPKSNFSWGYTKPTRHKSLLTWNFPAVAVGSSMLSINHIINTEKYYTESKPAFPWGQVGPLLHKKQNKPIHLWEDGLKQKGPGAINGIVSYSRWGTDSSPFLEHYILGRHWGLGHMESWYVSLAIAAETYPKLHKGKGLGPTKIPAFGDIVLNKYLEIGQKMWFKALECLRVKEVEEKPPEIPLIPIPPLFNQGTLMPFYKIGPRCEYK